MDTITYIVNLDGQNYGPYELAGIRELNLPADTAVMRPGIDSDWKVAAEIPELTGFLDVEQEEETPTSHSDSDWLSQEYYFKNDDGMFGPYSVIELSLLIQDEDELVAIGNTSDFRPIGTYSGLFDLLKQLADDHSEELAGIRVSREQLEKIIKEQEKELVALETELEYMRSVIPHGPKVTPVQFNPEDEYARLNELEEGLKVSLRSLSTIVPKDEAAYKKVFSSPNTEVEWYLDKYRTCYNQMASGLQDVENKSTAVQNAYEHCLDNAERYLAWRKQEVDVSLGDDLQKIKEEIQKQIKEQDKVSVESRRAAIDLLKRSLEEKKLELLRNSDARTSSLIDSVNEFKSNVRSKSKAIKDWTRKELNRSIDGFNAYFADFFDRKIATAANITNIDFGTGTLRNLPPEIIYLGETEKVYRVFAEPVHFGQKCFTRIINDRHSHVKYNGETSETAYEIVNSVVGRMLAASESGSITVSMIDAEDMSGTSDVFKKLNRNVFRIVSRPEEVRRYLGAVEIRMENILQNLLQAPYKTLYEYNSSKEHKEPYEIIVLKDFPSGLSSDTINLFKKIVKNGIKAGVIVLVLSNQDLIDSNDEYLKLLRLADMDVASPLFNEIDICSQGSGGIINFAKIGSEELHQIVQFINSGFDSKKEEVLKLNDFIEQKKDWWSRKSGNLLEIPFGISESKQLEYLRITQESGQNSALVIGIPGSGKSVFLHTVITNAAINYSPEELNMYLIDFSGVEFNTYALNHLPHAKVIAPEAEREFGLSVLRGLVEEGTKRMNLCRDYDVSNIVELREVAPQLKMPRLLVIIDEFQKFFEIENDSISRESNTLIHTIIQEFRKFGINLILATQKLPGAVLPKDLIANRIVFRCAPSDFTALISLPMGERVPQLSTGTCIYNSDSGSPYANSIVKTFFASKSDRDSLLNEIAGCVNERGIDSVGDTTVFRSAELPDVQNRRKRPEHSIQQEYPAEVGIYFGESIAIEDYDVFARIVPESNNNILIIGKETEVAEQIALNSAILAMDAHSDGHAAFRFLNFMRQATNPLYSAPRDYFEGGPFESVFASKQADVNAVLTDLKALIDERSQTEEQHHNVYMFIFDFQLGRMFDRGGRRGDDVSEDGQLLDYILKRGPQVNVFTVLQVDTLDNLARIGSPLTVFEHKVALQMEENESTRIIGSGVANKLHVMNRPASKFRAYYCDKSMNILTKFKPYK